MLLALTASAGRSLTAWEWVLAGVRSLVPGPRSGSRRRSGRYLQLAAAGPALGPAHTARRQPAVGDGSPTRPYSACVSSEGPRGGIVLAVDALGAAAVAKSVVKRGPPLTGAGSSRGLLSEPALIGDIFSSHTSLNVRRRNIE